MKLTPNNTDLYTLLHLEGGTLLYDGEEGSIVRDNCGTLLTDIQSGDALCRILRALDTEPFDVISLKGFDAQQAMMREFGFCSGESCSQWVYTKKDAPVCPPCDIRPLTLNELPIVVAHYHPDHDNTDYLRNRIEKGRMWGLYEDGVIAGFVGTHKEGSMGILEVFPEFRRKGYGGMLEAYLIGWLLARGQIPYGQVYASNDASMGLQEKLGMERCESPVIWMWKE